MTSAIDTEDPFGATVDADDPFATPAEGKAGGGSFEPTPTVADLNGWLVAYIPREFTDKAPKKKEHQKTPDDVYQDRYTVDLVILAGNDLSFYTKVKEGDRLVEKEITVPASEFPKMYTGTWIFQQALIGQLKKVHGSPRPILLGRVGRGPRAKDRDTETFESIAQAWKNWEARGRRGEAPPYSWQINVDITEAEREIAKRWWASAKDSIKL